MMEMKRGRRRTLLLVLCLGFRWYMSAGRCESGGQVDEERGRGNEGREEKGRVEKKRSSKMNDTSS